MPTAEERWFTEFAAHSDNTLWLQEPPGTMAYLSPTFEAMFGMPAGKGFDRDQWAALVHPDDLGIALSALPRSEQGEVVQIDYRIIRPSDGAVRWIRDKGFPLFGSDGKVQAIAGIARDITEEKSALEALAQSEERARLLLAELQHRVRNTLGVVRSIARRTAERSRDVREFSTHLDGRLAAFARVQALVTRAPDAGVSLREIAQDELLAHGAQEGRSLVLEGPDVLLDPRTAERISLAVHELSANAVKHGVLGARAGELEVRWSLSGEAESRVLGFSWKETKLGRTLRKPRRTGFGTELLTRTLAYELKAKSAMHFGKNGFSYTLFVPLPYVDEGERKSEEPRP
ncbi:sensor histidine kinase [Sphingomonas arenae]|uniref:sensor histidine kinase n=1 Tax=Sphingomonas arenae TaxID=2812555 RepID=UPI001968563F|nr:HWE histidine kinase domain-containing protein [Sphingomonas arenae]